MKALLANPEEFVGTLAEKLLMYAMGRNVQYYDAPALRSIIRQSAAANYRFESLVLGIVKSTPFQMREAQSAKRPGGMSMPPTQTLPPRLFTCAQVASTSAVVT